MNRSICEPSAKVRVPVQSALTVYVPEMDSLRDTSPLKLVEATLFSLPLPSKTPYPAMANGSCSLLPLISTPSKANGYVPCSVASEHFALEASSSLAYPAPTVVRAAAPATTVSRISATPPAHSLLRFIVVLLLLVVCCRPQRESSPPLLVWGSFPGGIVMGPNESAINLRGETLR